MSLFGKQKFYCNACGAAMLRPYSGLVGRDWKTCSNECNREMHLRYAKSIIGEDTTDCLCTGLSHAYDCPHHVRCL